MLIELTRGRVARVDDCDYEYLNQFNWFYSVRGYAVRNKPRPNIGMVKMHREVMGRAGICPPQVDHADRDKLNNTRGNLRPTDHVGNASNRAIPVNNTTGLKGVCQYGKHGKWRAFIKVNQKQVHIGCFDTKEEAAEARNKAALFYHGEFAYQNPI